MMDRKLNPCQHSVINQLLQKIKRIFVVEKNHMHSYLKHKVLNANEYILLRTYIYFVLYLYAF